MGLFKDTPASKQPTSDDVFKKYFTQAPKEQQSDDCPICRMLLKEATSCNQVCLISQEGIFGTLVGFSICKRPDPVQKMPLGSGRQWIPCN